MVYSVKLKNLLPNLEVLSLMYNQITIIKPHFWKNLPKNIKVVALGGNSFDCSCKLAPFVNWIYSEDQLTKAFILNQQYLCVGQHYGFTIFEVYADLNCTTESITAFPSPSKFPTLVSSTGASNITSSKVAISFTTQTTATITTKSRTAFDSGLVYLIGTILLSLSLTVLLVLLIYRFYKTRTAQSSPAVDAKLPKENFELEKLNPLKQASSSDESITIASTSDSNDSGNANFVEHCSSVNKQRSLLV